MKKNKLILMLTLMLILPFLFLSKTKAVTVGDFSDLDKNPCYYYDGSKVASGNCIVVGNDTELEYPFFQRKKLDDNKDFFCESGTLDVPADGKVCDAKNNSDHAYAIGYIVKEVYKNTAASYYWTEFLINYYLYDQTKNIIYETYHKDIPDDFRGISNKAEYHQMTYENWANARVNISAGDFTKNSNGDYYADFSIEISEGIFTASKLSFDCSYGSTSCKDSLNVSLHQSSDGTGTDISTYRVTVDVSDITYGQNVTVKASYNESKDFYKALEYDCDIDSSSGVEYQDIVTGYETVTKQVQGEYTKSFIKEEEQTTKIMISKIGKVNKISSNISGAQYILMLEDTYKIYQTFKDKDEAKAFKNACIGEIIDVTNKQEIKHDDIFDLDKIARGVCYRITTSNVVTELSLPRTTYYLVEEKAPAGYLLNTTPIKFSLNENTGKIESDSENIELGKKYIYLQDTETETKISKLNATNGKELPGATLQILDKDKKSISCLIKLSDGSLKKLDECTWVSREVPVYIYALAEGKYFLKETKAPEGFALSEEMVEFEVKADGTTTEVVMENALEVEVPDTLSFRSALLLFIGMFDIALGIGILLYVKKNKATE